MIESIRVIKILIVEDSPTQTLLLKKIFASEPDLQVVGCASNGQEAIKMTSLLKPNLITMDIQMPVMDGLEAIHQIMMNNPTPIVVISSKLQDKTLNTTFKALEAGALSVLEKPIDMTATSFDLQRAYMLDTIRSMSEVTVIKRTHYLATTKFTLLEPAVNQVQYELVALGASIGGPQALKLILSTLPKNFPVPITVVQHMTPGFISGFVNWLDEHTSLKIKEAKHLGSLIPGNVYFAPDHTHFTVTRNGENLIAKLVESLPVTGFCPSITVLLKSIATTCGKNAIGALLTGMGSDGAQGLQAMKQAHAHTLIQDPESAIVFGMAGVAEKLGAVDKVIQLDQMAHYLINLVHCK